MALGRCRFLVDVEWVEPEAGSSRWDLFDGAAILDRSGLHEHTGLIFGQILTFFIVSPFRQQS